MARKKTREEREAEKARMAKLVVDYFDTNYGRTAERLEKWQQLCRDVDVEVGRSITQCKKNLQGIYINIVDYVSAKKAGSAFRIFDSPKQLSDYMRHRPDKIFPRNKAKKNPLLRWMLVHIC